MHSPSCSRIMRVRPRYLLPCCMALGLRGALEGLATQEEHMSEEAQAFTSLTGWQLRYNLHDRLQCWLCFKSLHGTGSWSGQGTSSREVLHRWVPRGELTNFQLCDREARGWGLPLGNTPWSGGGFGRAFLLSIETASLCFQTCVVACSD